MTKRFENRIAVITGGMHGIGKATAERFTEEGATALVIDCAEGGLNIAELWVILDETCGAKWASRDEIRRMINEGTFAAYESFQVVEDI